MLKQITRGLGDPADGVRAAGALCVMALSRSVKALRCVRVPGHACVCLGVHVVVCTAWCEAWQRSGMWSGRGGVQLSANQACMLPAPPLQNPRSSLLETDVAEALCKLLRDPNPDVQVGVMLLLLLLCWVCFKHILVLAAAPISTPPCCKQKCCTPARRVAAHAAIRARHTCSP